MTGGPRKQCVVAYAAPDRQSLWTVDLPSEATIAQAVEAARVIANRPDIPWGSAPVGIFGELRDRSECPADGDRIELYRPLRSDPRDRRRERVQQQRKTARR